MPGRSYQKITMEDLKQLGQIARRDRENLFKRKPGLGQLYSGRLFAVALCQGAALHYLDGKNGIKDFDVWSFYREAPERTFPYRRLVHMDFGNSKFGKTDDTPKFIGRRVDLLGRSLRATDFSDPIGVLRTYLAQGKTTSAKRLAQKAVILIEPEAFLGSVVWPVLF